MGYYTYHNINIVAGDKSLLDSEEFQSFFEKTTNYVFGVINERNVKWYDSEKDMVTISKQYPNVVFEVYGDGENYDDNWVAYYCNGKTAGGQGELVYPKVDITQLDDIAKRNPELFI